MNLKWHYVELNPIRLPANAIVTGHLHVKFTFRSTLQLDASTGSKNITTDILNQWKEKYDDFLINWQCSMFYIYFLISDILQEEITLN